MIVALIRRLRRRLTALLQRSKARPRRDVLSAEQTAEGAPESRLYRSVPARWPWPVITCFGRYLPHTRESGVLLTLLS